MILGHNHSAIKQAVLDAVENGLSYGALTEVEILMAKVKALVPSIEKVRMVSSGTSDYTLFALHAVILVKINS